MIVSIAKLVRPTVLGTIATAIAAILGGGQAEALPAQIGSVQMQVTDTPVENASGVLSRSAPIAVHELEANSTIVLLEDVGKRAMGARAGAILTGIKAWSPKNRAEKRLIYCDLGGVRVFGGANIYCFEDSDGDSALDRRWLATAQGDPSFLFSFFAPSSVVAARFRAADVGEEPKFGLGLMVCRIGANPTFQLMIRNASGWYSGLGSNCPYRGVDGINTADGLRISYTLAGDQVAFEKEQKIPPGTEIVVGLSVSVVVRTQP